MATTYDEFMRANPDAVVIGGRDLDHDMEYEEHSGWERCNRCGDYENDMDDVCSDSPYVQVAVQQSDHYYGQEWEDHVEVSPGVSKYQIDEEE